ncbi:hypothetical protein DPEC_G00071150 [Dallia pectoralis]|uniref:Uncharacterized protein n=1 Tax=Dallia pectoralis TaxID=75939 RepID=A0ACC2H2C1_DALPE|nr:hypothetical protein DPEC_G00071150 [Dallia pectoralis]
MSGTKTTYTQDSQTPSSSFSRRPPDKQDMHPDPLKTQELYAQMEDILESLTQNNFQQLMKNVNDLRINTEARLRGAVDCIYDRAIRDPSNTVVYANMCRSLMTLKVPTFHKPGVTVNFRKLLLHRVRAAFENIGEEHEILPQKKMNAIAKEDSQIPRDELDEAKIERHRQSLGNIRLMCELYKLKMVTESIMHDSIVRLLKINSEDSLEGLCILLTYTGKDLDLEKAKPRMDQYYRQIEKIVKNGTTSPRIIGRLQDLLDLRKNMSDTKTTYTQDSQTPSASFSRRPPEKQDMDLDPLKTQELYAQIEDILESLTQNNFRQLMKNVNDLPINTEARLRGTVDCIYDRAIRDPSKTVVYANMCRILMTLKVPTIDKPGVTVNFRKLFLNRVETAFENIGEDHEILPHKEMNAIAKEDSQIPRDELDEAKIERHRQSLGNIRLMCELYKLKMLTECIMHDSIVRLLKRNSEDSLEGLCILLTYSGKDLDLEKAKPRMDHYYSQIAEIVKNGTTSPRIIGRLQDLLDLRKKRVHVPIKTCQQRIQEREEELQKQRQEVESIKSLSQAIVEDSEGFFTKLIETRCSEVRELIQAKELEMVSEAQGLIKTLEQELDELRRAETEGTDLLHLNDKPHFLQDLPSITEAFKEVRTYASEMQQQFEDSSKLQIMEFTESVNESLEPYTISDLLTSRQAVEERDLEDFLDLETIETEGMYEQMDDILYRLTPKNFHQLMKVVSAFHIDTEDKVKGIIDLIYKSAIETPTSAELYAMACHHQQLMGLKVPGMSVNFRKLLLNRCQRGFEQDNSKILREMQKKMEASIEEEECNLLREELEETKAKARRELIGNITFVCQLFKLKMISESIIHSCIGKLLKDADDDSLEALCTLFFIIGKDLEYDKNQAIMDEHYRQIQLINNRGETSHRIGYMLTDVIDSRGLYL